MNAGDSQPTVEFDATKRVYNVNGYKVTEQLVEHALTHPWWWQAQRHKLKDFEKAAITAVMHHLEAGHGPIDA